MKQINRIEDEAETYFIQFVFTRNRDLFRKNYHQLYNEIFKKYLKIYKEGRKMKVDLFEINKKFLTCWLAGLLI